MRISDWSSDVCSSDLATPLEHVPGYYREELAHLAATERVVHLIDIVLRRTSLAFVGGMTPETLREITDAVADALGWDAERRDPEVARTVEVLRTAPRVELEIGRPACRDRGCQYVSISVVALPLNKKQELQTQQKQ